MTDLAEVAASVAKALELRLVTYDHPPPPDPMEWRDERNSSCWLDRDGSNLTDPYWIWRCVEWLRTQTINVCIRYDDSCYHSVEKSGQVMWACSCPAAEFPARAIYELMKERK